MKIALVLPGESDLRRARIWMLAGHEVETYSTVPGFAGSLWGFKSAPKAQVVATSCGRFVSRMGLLVLSRVFRVPLVYLALEGQEVSLDWSGRMFFRRCNAVLVSSISEAELLKNAGAGGKHVFALEIDVLEQPERERVACRLILQHFRTLARSR